MILTAKRIQDDVECKRIIITPFDAARLDQNSYTFALDAKLLTVGGHDEINEEISMCDTGYVLQPSRCYLGSTVETMGSDIYVTTLHANRSLSSLGVWLHFSAPLGHSGAVIPWTLEIRCVKPIRVYPGMPLGKIAFWEMDGSADKYEGRYRDSVGPVHSRIWSASGGGGQ